MFQEGYELTITGPIPAARWDDSNDVLFLPYLSFLSHKLIFTKALISFFHFHF